MNDKPQWVELKWTTLEHHVEDGKSRWSHNPDRIFEHENILAETILLQQQGWRASAPTRLHANTGSKTDGIWISEAVLVSMQQYVQATKALVEDYKEGANSGDWGFWEFEKEPEIIAYREAEKNLDSILNPQSQL